VLVDSIEQVLAVAFEESTPAPGRGVATIAPPAAAAAGPRPA